MSTGTVLSKDSLQLIAKLVASGSPLVFTRAAVGTGKLPAGYDPGSMTGLNNYRMDGEISKIEASGEQADISFQISSIGVDTGFIVTEAGLFAEDPDKGEILFSYLDLSADPQYIYPENSTISKFFELTMSVIIGRVSSVTTFLSPGSLVTREQLNAELKPLKDEVAETKKSASDGKALIAAAITLKKVATAATDTFAQMAENIKNIISGAGTATAADVLAGKTFTNSTGVETTGTMVNRGAVSQALNAGESYAVPEGYHNGNGAVTANSLAGQTAATAVASQILAGITAWINGIKVTGTMANRGAVSQTLVINGTYTIPEGYHDGSGKITQSITTKGAATYTPGTSEQTIPAGVYITGAQKIAAIPSNYYNANTQQTVFSYGSYGTAASLGAYYTSSGFNANPSRPAIITSNKGLSVGGSSSNIRIIFRQAFPPELKYIRFVLQVSVIPMDWNLYVIDPATMLSVGTYTFYKGSYGAQTHTASGLADKIAGLPNGWFLCFAASAYGSVEDYGIYEITLSPTAF